MGVFKDDQLVAKVLGRQPQTLKKSNSKIAALAGCAVAVLALGGWAVVAHKNANVANASATASAATPSAAVLDTDSKGEAALATFSAAAPTPLAVAPLTVGSPAGLGDSSKGHRHLPPVIEEFRVEAVELHPKFSVRLIESHAESHTELHTEASPRAPSEPVKSAEISIDAGEHYEQAKKIEESAKGVPAQLEHARALYQKAIDSGRLPTPLEVNCLARLNDLTAKLILDPKVACLEPKAEFHKVDTGDGVEKIARKHKVNQGQIKRLNHLNDKLNVRLGQNLKMLPGEAVFKVDKEKLTGTLYIDGVYIKRYPVGIGPNNATPKGSYVVENKVMNPDWFYEGKKVPYGDAKNILGTRWMGMANTATGANGAGLGVHGTALPESVPGRESKGCVRMHNEDVEELYDFMPQGGKVVIE